VGAGEDGEPGVQGVVQAAFGVALVAGVLVDVIRLIGIVRDYALRPVGKKILLFPLPAQWLSHNKQIKGFCGFWRDFESIPFQPKVNSVFTYYGIWPALPGQLFLVFRLNSDVAMAYVYL